MTGSVDASVEVEDSTLEEPRVLVAVGLREVVDRDQRRRPLKSIASLGSAGSVDLEAADEVDGSRGCGLEAWALGAEITDMLQRGSARRIGWARGGTGQPRISSSVTWVSSRE